MPTWLIKLLVSLAMTVGIPLLKSVFKGLPDAVWEAVEAFLKSIKVADVPSNAVAKAAIHMRTCEGVACHLDTMKE